MPGKHRYNHTVVLSPIDGTHVLLCLGNKNYNTLIKYSLHYHTKYINLF